MTADGGVEATRPQVLSELGRRPEGGRAGLSRWTCPVGARTQPALPNTHQNG